MVDHTPMLGTNPARFSLLYRCGPCEQSKQWKMVPWGPTRTWFSRHGGVGMTVGLDDLRGLFQP